MLFETDDSSDNQEPTASPDPNAQEELDNFDEDFDEDLEDLGMFEEQEDFSSHHQTGGETELTEEQLAAVDFDDENDEADEPAEDDFDAPRDEEDEDEDDEDKPLDNE